jgi:competence protein ComEC
MFWAAWPVMAAVLAADGWWLAGVILWVLLMGVGAWVGTWRWRALALVCSLCAGMLHGVRMEWQRENARVALENHMGVELEGVVLNEPEQNGESWNALVRVTRCAGEGKTFGGRVWWEGRGETPRQGSRVSARGRIGVPSVPRNPGGFDMSGWLHRQGTDIIFQALHGTQSVQTGWLARVSTDARAAFREAVTCGLAEDSREARVIRAMVLGDMPRDDEMLIDSFRESGELHVFVVSGQRVLMVQLFLWLLLGWCRVPRRTAVWLLIAAGFAYCWLTGMRPPAARAAWMAAVFLGGFLARRRPDALNTLGVALTGYLLWDGNDLFLPGVQLSYAVVGVIAAMAGACGASPIFRCRLPGDGASAG